MATSPERSDIASVDKKTIPKARRGIPIASVSQLFQRAVKNFSFVIVSLLSAYRFPDIDA
jgi:hypothetical protein